jgi:hypothetical protein
MSKREPNLLLTDICESIDKIKSYTFNYTEQVPENLQPVYNKNIFVNLIKVYTMRTINISISDIEFSKFGIKSENLNFTEFIELVTKELTRQNLNKSIELAEKYGIAKMTMEDITNEVKADRGNAKSGN